MMVSSQLRPCLLDNRSVDLKTVLRRGGSDGDIEARFVEAARRKPGHHRLDDPDMDRVAALMSAIGG